MARSANVLFRRSLMAAKGSKMKQCGSNENLYRDVSCAAETERMGNLSL